MNDIDLKLQVVETATEWIIMCDSPAGGATARVPHPFSADEIGSALHDLEMSLIRSYSPVVTRRTMTPQRTALQFGQRLAEVLLTDDTRLVFEGCRRLAKENKVRLRVLLETHGGTVSRIPWEFAVDPMVRDDFVSLRFSFARHLRVASPMPPLELTPPLQVLVVHSHPSDREGLDAETEWASVSALEESHPDLIQVTRFEGDRWTDLSETLRAGGWHILHFIGHGGFDEEAESGFVEMTRDDGTAQQVPARLLGAAAAQTNDLRLVVLNACESASTGECGTSSSTAAKLMAEGIPAVVAMQFEITDPAALTFAKRFYAALAKGRPVDQAVAESRRGVLLNHRSLEWATPVLFLASREARLFTVPQQSVVDLEPEPDLGPDVELDGGPDAELDEGPDEGPGREPEREPGSGAASAPAAPPAPPPDPAPTHPSAPEQRELQRVATTAPLADCTQAALGPRGLVAMACVDGSLRAWRLGSGSWASRCTLPRGVRVTALAWSPWPRHLASAQDDGTVVVWDLQKEVAIRVLHPAARDVRALDFTGDGRWLVVVGADRSIEMFDDRQESQWRFQIPVHQGTTWGATGQAVGPAVLEAGDRHLVVAANDGGVVRLDVRGEVVTRWPHQHEVRGLAVSENRLATWSLDGRLRFWDLEGDLRHRGDQAQASHLMFSPDGLLLVAGGTDRQVRVWSTDGDELGAAKAAGPLVGVGWIDDEILTCTDRGVLETWTTTEGQGHGRE